MLRKSFYEKYRKIMTEYDDQLTLDALIEIHARACLVASEIRLLVLNGYADGAYARWRSLHELCIVLLFLYDGDEQTTKMYLDYEVIETWDKLKKYQDSFPKIGWSPVAERMQSCLRRNATV